jgi:hypothetical protein
MSRVALTGILVVAAALKFVALSMGQTDDVLGGPWGVASSAVAEVLVVALLWGTAKSAWLGAVGCILLAAVGIAVAFAPVEKRCGCLGSVELARWQHVMLAATVGALGSDVLRLASCKRAK